MNTQKSQSTPDPGDAAWAYNRWPTIGLYTGGGLGAILGVVFPPFGWLKLIAIIVVGAIGGCVLGFISARVFFGRDVDERHENNDELQS